MTRSRQEHDDRGDDDDADIFRFFRQWLVELDDLAEDTAATVRTLVRDVRTPRTAQTTIDTNQRNPHMTTQIHDNDTTKVISVLAGSYQDAIGVAITPDPTNLTPVWTSSDLAVATVDPTTGAITPVLPVAAGVTTTITGTATNPDGSIVTYQPQDVEIIAGPPATANTQIL